MTHDETVALQEYAKELSEPRTEGEACALETVSANELQAAVIAPLHWVCLLYTSPSPRDA